MKALVIYFSLTGNTRKIAHAIHSGINQHVDRCDITTMKKFHPGKVAEYDFVALGSPVWGGVPPHVMRFVKEIPSESEMRKHIVLFCTHGAWPERFYPPLIDELTKKGFIVIGVRNWYASVYRPASPKPYPTDGHPDEVDLREAEEFGRETSELSRLIYEGTARVPVLPRMKMVPRNTFVRPAPVLHREKCHYPECRICMDHCPLGGIDLSKEEPVFAKPCVTCYFCEMICPYGAVEADYKTYETAFRKDVENKFLKVLEEAEQEGNFRRLVPVDEIGWNTPYYVIHDTHPRYVIPEEDRD